MNGVKLYLYKAAHAAITVFTFFFIWVLFRYGRFGFAGPDRFRYNYYVAGMFSVLLVFFGKTYNIYLVGFQKVRALVMSQFIAQMFSLVLSYGITCIAWAKWPNPALLAVLIPVWLIIDVLWSIYGNRLYFSIYPRMRAVAIYRNNVDRHRIEAMGGKPAERVYTVENYIRSGSRNYGELMEMIQDYDAVFVAGVDATTRNGIAKYCVETGTPGFFLPHIGDILMSGANHIQSFTSPVLNVNRCKPSFEYMLVKRVIDIAASLVGIAVLSPIMLIIAAGIKLQDGGKIIYRQTRLTLNGKKFDMFKFRSMREDAEADGIARLSTGTEDKRVTPIGKFIRACRLDELPQLFNILKGDMTIVGPRPERPQIAEQYYETLPEFKLRLQVKAGLTGYAQVYGKYNTEPYEKLEFDLLYINNMSILTDIQLMFATFGVLFKKESTEGVAQNKTND